MKHNDMFSSIIAGKSNLLLEVLMTLWLWQLLGGRLRTGSALMVFMITGVSTSLCWYVHDERKQWPLLYIEPRILRQ